MRARPASRGSWWRVLERHLEARIVVALAIGIPALAAVGRGHVVIGIAGLALATAFVLVLPWWAPPARLRRLERRAREALPAGDVDVVLSGTVAAVAAPLIAPRGTAPCAAYWQRTVVETGEGHATSDESSASVEFVLRCGDVLVAVEGTNAKLLFDPARARRTPVPELRAVYEELIVGVGDRVVVSGRVVHGDGGGPHRGAPRLVRAGRRPVTVALVGPRT